MLEVALLQQVQCLFQRLIGAQVPLIQALQQNPKEMHLASEVARWASEEQGRQTLPQLRHSPHLVDHQPQRRHSEAVARASAVHPPQVAVRLEEVGLDSVVQGLQEALLRQLLQVQCLQLVSDKVRQLVR